MTTGNDRSYTAARMATEPDPSGWSGMQTGWSIVSTMIGGMLTLGALGYLVDRVVGTESVFTGIGIVLGGVAGTYILYLRYGRGDGDSS